MDKEKYKAYKEWIEEVNGLNYMLVHGRMNTFPAGSETIFAGLLEAWTIMYNDSLNHNNNGTEKHIDYEKILIYTFAKSVANLNWEKVWFSVNERIYSEHGGLTHRSLPIELVFEYMIKSISYDAFVVKINKCNDPLLVYEFYMLYGEKHGISKEEMQKKYEIYLKKFIKRVHTSYAVMLNSYYNELSFRPNQNIEDLVCMLIKKTDLNYVVNDNEEKIALKDKIAVDSVILHNSDEVIKCFLEVNKDLYFKGIYGNLADRCQINLKLKNNDEAMRIFNSDEYQLNSPYQLEILKRHQVYDIAENGNFLDRLPQIIMCADEDTLLKILYSDKVKVINAWYLHVIENIIGKEEYQKFMEHVKTKNIPIYYIQEAYETIYISKDLEETLRYVSYNINHDRRELVRSHK